MWEGTRARRILGLAAVLAVSASACGGDDDGGSDDGRPDPDDPVGLLAETGDANPSCTAQGDGTLRIGGLIPESGETGALLGAPQLIGARLAVADVNAAGGVLDQEVALEQLDPGEDGAQVEQQAGTHLTNNVDAVLGPSTAQAADAVVEAVTSACTIMFSPSNTAAGFTTIDDGDLYFRTAPSDVLQGRALADAAVGEDIATAAVVASDDGYSQGLREFIIQPFEDRGGEVVLDESYDPAAPDHTELVRSVAESEASALFLVGSDESGAILARLIEQGFDPATKRVFLVETNMTAGFAQSIPTPGALRGVRGTVPGAKPSEEFRARLLAENPDLPTVKYGAEAYDAVVVLTLAAIAAGTDQADAVARHVNGITRDGEECTSFEQCKAMLDQARNIDYQGQSGPLEFGRPGEPTAVNYGLYPWTDQNTVDQQSAEFIPVSLAS